MGSVYAVSGTTNTGYVFIWIYNISTALVPGSDTTWGWLKTTIDGIAGFVCVMLYNIVDLYIKM